MSIHTITVSPSQFARIRNLADECRIEPDYFGEAAWIDGMSSILEMEKEVLLKLRSPSGELAINVDWTMT